MPVFNEEAVLPLLVERLRTTLAGTGETREVIFVNDGSHDHPLAALRGLAAAAPRRRRPRAPALPESEPQQSLKSPRKSPKSKRESLKSPRKSSRSKRRSFQTSGQSPQPKHQSFKRPGKSPNSLRQSFNPPRKSLKSRCDKYFPTKKSLSALPAPFFVFRAWLLPSIRSN